MDLKDYMNVHTPFVSHAVLYSNPNVKKQLKYLKKINHVCINIV